ncbi:MAG: type II CRISPR RNA-guided endonuclease Cas9, partial [Bacteroidales bacterium]|nr:type II CRISPR RNA-guided endonuclease Cas9 [Bacteroidales bacterium]
HGHGSTFETYRLRAKAVDEEISLQEFARVLLMINKKRGYKSSRKAKSEDEGQATNGMEIAKVLYRENITPGELVLRRLNESKYNIPEFYRSDLQSEFDKIWNCQKTFYPDLLTDKLKEELKNKNSKQTYGICKSSLNIEGMKRQTKGEELKKENYSWRVEALNKQISLEQLAVVLQELNAQLNKTDSHLGRISNRSKELYFGNKTVGQYIMGQLEENPNYSLANQVFYRQDYLDEFEKLWDTQSRYHKELTNELKHEIGKTIIFFQRPLKSQKGLISICELERKEITIEQNGHRKTIQTGPRVCPKSSPHFQEFKIWQTINNLQIEGRVLPNTQKDLFGEAPDHKYGKRFLSEEEKAKLFEELNVCQKLSDKQIIELLFGKKTDIKLNFQSVDGNTTNARFLEVYKQIAEAESSSTTALSKLTGSKLVSYLKDFFAKQGYNIDLLHFDINTETNIFEHQATYRLWHLIYSFEGDNSKTGNDKLIKKISELYGFEEEYASMIANITFSPDYGSLSTKAMCKILPHLRKGLMYSEACEQAGYKHSARSLTREELDQKVLKDYLELLPKNSLRNPVVEKILNQMINVVNQIIETYDKPDEIRIELARELKKSAKEREEADKKVREAKKEHDTICERLKETFGIESPSRNDIIRYKLYKELEPNGFKTIYTNTYIRQEELFSKKFDIEHIIPQALRFDDSFSNKTLELRSANIEKGKKTAYDYISEKNGSKEIEEYKSRVKLLLDDGKISKAKYKNLMTRAEDIDGGFINRDLRDSQYIAKKAREILESIVKVVTTTTGSITDRLREDWQLVDVMKELNW